jgi:hypothetical protein
MTTLRLAVRVLRGGGAAGSIRLLLMVVGIAIAVTTVLFVFTVPGALANRGTVAGTRFPTIADDETTATFRFRMVDDSWHDQAFTRILLTQTKPDAAAPPGLTRFPAPGQVWLSPALAAATHADPGLSNRLPGSVAGQIAPTGLAGPDELFAYIGVDAVALGDGSDLGRGWYGLDSVTSDATDQASRVGLELGLLIAVPAAGYLLICARLSAATRTRRYGALRLLGLRRAEMLRVAAVESALAGGCGAILGAVVYRLLNPVIAASGIAGFSWFPQQSTLGGAAVTATVVVVVLISTLVGAAGAARSLRRPLAARFDPVEPAASWWLAVPLALGLALIVEPILLQRNEPGHPQRLNTASGILLMLGLVLTFVGLLLAIRPILVATASAIARREPTAAIRIAARRLAVSPAPVVRLLTGLVLLVLVAGTGAGITRDLEVAAGPAVTEQLMNVPADGVPAAARGQVHELGAPLRWASVGSIVTPPHGRTIGSPTDFLNYVGISLIVASCKDAEELAGVALPGCQDGNAYRIVDTSPDPNIPSFPAGTAVSFHDGNGDQTTLSLPAGALNVDLPPNSLFGGSTVLFAGDSSPIGWSSDVTFHFLVPNDSQLIEKFKSSVTSLAPAAEIEVPAQNLDALERYRIQRGTLTFGVWVGFLLGCLAFVIAMVDRAVDRRRDVVSLAVLGMPRRAIRLTQFATVMLPLAIGLGSAALVGNLVANAFLRMDGRQFGWYQGSWRLTLVPVLAGLVLATLASLLVPGERVRSEDLRRE